MSNDLTSIMSNDEQEIQFTNFFTPAAGYEQKSNFPKMEKDETRTGQILDCVNTYRLGTTFLCIIPDRVLTKVNPQEPGLPRLYRKVSRPLDGRVQDPDNEKFKMSIQIPQLKDFKCSLSPSQQDIIKHLHEQGKRFMDLTAWDKRKLYPEVNEMIRISNPAQIVFAYGKLIKFISADKGDVIDPEIGHVRVLKFAKGQVGKNDFVTVLMNAIKNKSDALGTSAWMSYFFNRTAGERNKIVALSVSQSNDAIKSYLLSTSLEETKPFEVTKEDLDVADNLDKRVFNIETFDDEYYQKLTRAFDHVQDVIDDLGAELNAPAPDMPDEEEDGDSYPF